MPTKSEVVSALGEWLDYFSVESGDGLLSLFVKPGDWVPDDVFKPLMGRVVGFGGRYDSLHRAVRIPVDDEPAHSEKQSSESEFTTADKLIMPGMDVMEYAGLRGSADLPSHDGPIPIKQPEREKEEKPAESTPKPELKPWPRMVEFLPLLSTSEKEALAESLKQYGLKHDILALKDGRIIDGHHRWALLGGKVPPEKIEWVDLDDETAFGLGVSLNIDRRQLTPEIVNEVRAAQKKAYLQFRNKEFKPQGVAARLTGTPQSTASRWDEENASNIHVDNTSKLPDQRVSIPKSEIPKILERTKSGETQEQIAADYKASHQRISQIVSEASKPPKPENDFSPQPFNVWNFSGLDDRFGKEVEGFRGRIPGQIVQNLLYYFGPEKTGIIVDPMAGTGTTLDVVKWWNTVYGTSLVCLSYDKDPKRTDIAKHDVAEGLPEETAGCDLVFLDPPYYDMVFDQFKNYQEFYAFISSIAVECSRRLRPNGIVALLISDLTRNNPFEPLTLNCANIFRGAGFGVDAIIDCPLTTQSANGREVKTAIESKKLLGRRRELYIFRRPT